MLLSVTPQVMPLANQQRVCGGGGWRQPCASARTKAEDGPSPANDAETALTICFAIHARWPHAPVTGSPCRCLLILAGRVG